MLWMSNLLSLTPFDDDNEVEVKLSKSKDMDVVVSNCNPVSHGRDE